MKTETPFQKDLIVADPRTFSSGFMSLVISRVDHRAFATILNAAFSDPDRKSSVTETVKGMCDAPGLHMIDRDRRVVKVAFSEVAKHVKDAELKAHIEDILSRHMEMRLDLAGFEGQMPYYSKPGKYSDSPQLTLRRGFARLQSMFGYAEQLVVQQDDRRNFPRLLY